MNDQVSSSPHQHSYFSHSHCGFNVYFAVDSYLGYIDNLNNELENKKRHEKTIHKRGYGWQILDKNLFKLFSSRGIT